MIEALRSVFGGLHISVLSSAKVQSLNIYRALNDYKYSLSWRETVSAVQNVLASH